MTFCSNNFWAAALGLLVAYSISGVLVAQEEENWFSEGNGYFTEKEYGEEGYFEGEDEYGEESWFGEDGDSWWDEDEYETGYYGEDEGDFGEEDWGESEYYTEEWYEDEDSEFLDWWESE